MKPLFGILLLTLSLQGLANTDLPGCELKATPDNELPFDVVAQVVQEEEQLYLQFAKEKLPVQLGVMTDMNVISYVVESMGYPLPRRAKSIEYYEYATAQNQVIMYLLKSATGKTLAKFLLVDGVGGACEN